MKEYSPLGVAFNARSVTHWLSLPQCFLNGTWNWNFFATRKDEINKHAKLECVARVRFGSGIQKCTGKHKKNVYPCGERWWPCCIQYWPHLFRILVFLKQAVIQPHQQRRQQVSDCLLHSKNHLTEHLLHCVNQDADFKNTKTSPVQSQRKGRKLRGFKQGKLFASFIYKMVQASCWQLFHLHAGSFSSVPWTQGEFSYTGL